MSPERAGSPIGLEPRELALALQSAVPPFKLVRLHLNAQQPSTVTPEKIPVQEQPDDDLTSLSWLQDNNLLKGMNLTCAKGESDDLQTSSNGQIDPRPTSNTSSQQSTTVTLNYCADQSPTSDYMDESSVSEPTDSSSSSLNSPVPYSYNNTPTSSPSKSNKHPHNVKYDPMIHTFSKPPYSFSCLIFMAIEDSPMKALPVKDIYAWILDHFPYFKNAPTGWKNSVRHNLSLNKCFQKVEKSPNLGKGSLWMVDQQYRPNLLQALTRSPFHPCSTLDPATFRSASSRTSSPFVQQMIDTKTSTRLPNPELFPYLSRRLAASEAVKQEVKVEPNSDDDSSLDDVHAATAILALKHGARINIPDHRQKHCIRQQTNDSVDPLAPTEMVQVITRSPSEDHTYSSSTKNHSMVKQEPHSPRPPSPDEAFESDDSMHSRLNFSTMDLEEQRRIEEGADALLNLAGISTLRSNNTNSNNNNNIINSNKNHITEYNRTSPSSTKRTYDSFIKTTNRTPEDRDGDLADGDDEDDDDEDMGGAVANRSRNHQMEPERVAREQKFRPRMLRMKRKHVDNGTIHQSSKRKHLNNNNNNVVDNKVAAKFISARKLNGDWATANHRSYKDDQLLSSHR